MLDSTSANGLIILQAVLLWYQVCRDPGLAYVIPVIMQSHGEPRAVPTCLSRQGQAQITLGKHRTWGASHSGRMIDWDGSSTSAHKSKFLWVVNPILIDKSPQPCYRLNHNPYIDLLQPDHLVGISGGLNHTTKCATWQSHGQSHRDAPSCAHLRATWCIKDRHPDHN